MLASALASDDVEGSFDFTAAELVDAARWKAVKFGQIKCSQLAMPNLPKRGNIAEGIMRACVQYRACIHACIVKTAAQVWTWDIGTCGS